MKAIVTSITGQDGASLTQLLLEKGYTPCGIYHRPSSVVFWCEPCRMAVEAGVNRNEQGFSF